MFEDIDAAAERIRDKRASWVDRRDAAEILGRAAMRALAPLHELREEMDVDVRRSIESALGHAASVLNGVIPRDALGPIPLEELVRSCEKKGEREVLADGDAFVVKVTLKTGRSQHVHVKPLNRKDGVRLYQVYSVCGKADEKTYAWALRANAKMAQAAIALTGHDDEERFVLVNCFLVEEVSCNEMKASVKEVAYLADWMEQRLGNTDEF
ncbi:MAG: hypothetical protein K1Y02_01785 [Candidatus Hydrogenedentes bacterium]|nr:hypothetical protein [Candidatus Hydrogenedentota bacterium]